MVSYRERGIATPILRLAGCGLSLGLLILIAGCGKSRLRSVEHTEVSGKVLFQGKPLPGGVVNFVAVNGGFANTGLIDENGNYKVDSPEGEVNIGVSNLMLRRPTVQTSTGGDSKKEKSVREEKAAEQQRGPGARVKGRYVRLPKSYTDPSTSGLKYTVKPGPQTHDIELSANAP